jgi:hypothetical protein
MPVESLVGVRDAFDCMNEAPGGPPPGALRHAPQSRAAPGSPNDGHPAVGC